MFMCGTGAIFVEKKEEKICAQAATMGIVISEPSFSNIPEVVDVDSEIYVSFEIKNISTVPIYLRDNIVYWVNGEEQNDNVKNNTLDFENDVTISKENDGIQNVVIESVKSQNAQSNELGINESVNMIYKITFPGIAEISNGILSIKGRVEYSASTSRLESEGFMIGPISKTFDLSDGQLKAAMIKDDMLTAEILDENYQNTDQYVSDNVEIMYESEESNTESADESIEEYMSNMEPALCISTQSEVVRMEDDLMNLATLSEIVS